MELIECLKQSICNTIAIDYCWRSITISQLQCDEGTSKTFDEHVYDASKRNELENISF